ncbi:hypothetical protein N7456_003059 [Penicillium angulare]|uniref:Capsule polysaccharide biosynthesis protein n=1 Tax=Penicillium angulare TaxID=116970 RepID=A0A9W9FU42_9EURO|nr:hypothetical protein N7456_003059 [Penicillium angulare]
MSSSYPIPPGVHALPKESLDLRPDTEIDTQILNPPPITSIKNIWFFWHSGYPTMHPYTKRTVRAWHRRFTKKGWTIRVIDQIPNSKSNVSQYLDTNSRSIFPSAFVENRLSGTHALQHTSDLVRWPLLLKYGGVYADVGLMQIGDLDELWNKTVADENSPYEVLSYSTGEEDRYTLANYFMGCAPGNELFSRCHELLLAIWNEDGGRLSTEGTHASPLLRGVPLMGGGFTITNDDGSVISAEDASKMLTDYIIQGQAATATMGIVDPASNWDGPAYCREHFYALPFMDGAQLINEFTNWDGQRAFDLMSLYLPGVGEEEGDDQKAAREIVEACLKRSFAFKLAHGLILKVFKHTLGSLWRGNEGSDVVEGTYADWLRFGMVYWAPDVLMENVELPVIEPIRVGGLLDVE